MDAYLENQVTVTDDVQRIDLAFNTVMDLASLNLRRSLEDTVSQDALEELNQQGTNGIMRLEEVSKCTAGVYMAQGICLLAAGFEHHKFMQTAYQGPPSPLESVSVRTLRGFKGGQTDTVRL